MRNLFLDCGSNIGQGFRGFRKIYGIDNFDYHLFEPNPWCFKELQANYGTTSYVTLNNVAVTTENKKVLFYFPDLYSQGATLVVEHNSNYHKNELGKNIEVDAIDLAEYIIKHSLQYKDIVLKLDVESSEYDILEKLLDTKIIKRLKKIYVEFHTQYMDSNARETYVARERNIISRMKSDKVDFKIWK